ncbi:MAG: efflux RND transporter periplasmic adaptor subunit [Saprospiraceae bacterium]|nr:efflux RND transporter periplasmic adaptor subunit [Saprospiraceae bacterium]
MQKKILLRLLLLIVVLLVVWKLWSNHRQLTDEAELSKVGRTFVPVGVATVQTAPMRQELEADGIFLPAKEMFVISETAGRVIDIFKNKGEWVKEGEIIAKVDDELLRIELEATQANLAKLRKDRERVENLIEGEAAPRNKIEDLELGIFAAEAKEKGLKKQISNTSIKAPMTGTLGLRFIERGSVIGPGIQIGQMTNLEKLFLMVKVTERDVLQVVKGQPVEVKADVYPDAAITGKVTNIGLRADNAFSYDVEIEVANPAKTPLRGGMHARARFHFPEQRNVLTIPRKAIAGSLQDAKVFLLETDTVAVQRKIDVGAIQGEQVEVKSGLKLGDQVVVSGQMNLQDGVRVKVVEAVQLKN